jgi:hypothetical protein
MVLKIGKSVLEVGKMLFLLYTEETNEVFIPSVVYYPISSILLLSIQIKFFFC